MTQIHPECAAGCRRGNDETPCRVVGGCGVRWAPVCLLCSVSLDRGHICPRCIHGIASDLSDIERLLTMASVEPGQGRGQGRTVPGSRPPITVDGVDPELALVRIVPGDPSTDVPLLVVLEDWERIIREDRRLPQYGLASEARLAATGPLHGASYAAHTHVTVTGVIAFLRRNLAWAADEPSFDIAELARQVRLCRRQASRWDADRSPAGWRVPCPTVHADGDCGQTLHVSRGQTEVYCRACRREWPVERLLRVAGRDADVWIDTEAAAHLAGVSERTIRKWVARGHIRKRGQLVRLLDIREHADALTA